MRKLQQQMLNRRLKGRFNNEQKYKVGLIIYQPIPDFYCHLLFITAFMVVLVGADKLEYDFTNG